MLKRQLYIVYILSLFVPICMIGSILIYNNYSMLYRSHEDILTSDNLRIRSIVFEATTSITNICDAIAEDKEAFSLLTTNYSQPTEAEKALQSFTLLNDYYERHTEISSITLYTDNKSLFSFEHVRLVDETNTSWFNEVASLPGYYWSTLKEENRFGVAYQELQMVHTIRLPSSDKAAVLVISISNNYLKNRIDNNNLKVDITVNHDSVFFSTWGKGNQIINFRDYHEKEFFIYSGVNNYLGEESLLEVSTIKPIKSDDSIYIFSKDPLAVSKIKRIMFMTLGIIVMSILIPLIVIVRYTKQLTKRVDTLRIEMHRVTGGDYNIIENFKGNDELVDLFKDLKIMIRSIEERDALIFEGTIKEQQLINSQQKIEMELLSSKINPHFLYNTLETIRMKAFNADDLEVASAVKLLGRYMRYNLESTGEVTTLESELSYIKIYLSIQELRFTNRISHYILVDESIDLSQIKILPLLIQPIVENAFIHGHKETLENGRIQINILDRNEQICIQVEDNGSGIDDARLEAIYQKLENQNQQGRTNFGLYNIHQRLRLFYGKSYGLKIDASLDKGTLIEFSIPKER